MDTGTYGEAVIDQQVHVSAMAALVRELVTGGGAGLRDGRRLRERSVAAGLDAHECDALEALRVRLRDQGAAGFGDSPTGVWY